MEYRLAGEPWREGDDIVLPLEDGSQERIYLPEGSFYISSIRYDFGIDCSNTESLTLVGSNKVWQGATDCQNR